MRPRRTLNESSVTMALFSAYDPCPCQSGQKLKFCCNGVHKKSPQELNTYLSKLPVYGCYITEGWQQKGIANVAVAKQMPNGMLAIGYFLVDIWCLGIKDAFYELNSDGARMRAIIDNSEAPGIPITYEDARSLIFGALNYAKEIGFAPHKDWEMSRLILEPERSFDDAYIFGHDGKPHYVNGPYDLKERDVKAIINKVTQAGGRWDIISGDDF